MSVDDLYELTIRSECQGQPVFNLLHYRVSEEGGSEDPNPVLLSEAWELACVLPYLALSTDQLLLIEIVTQRIARAADPYPGVRGPLRVNSVNLAGTQVGDSMPAFTTYHATTYADKPDGSYVRGAIYPGVPPESFQDEGLITGPALANLGTFLDVIRAPIVDAATPANTYQLCIFSVTEWIAAVANPWYDVTLVNTDSRVSHQDRRKRGTSRGGY